MASLHQKFDESAQFPSLETQQRALEGDLAQRRSEILQTTEAANRIRILEAQGDYRSSISAVPPSLLFSK